MPEFIKKEDVIWKDTKIIKLSDEGAAETHPYRYKYQLPVPLADWDVFDYWEKERFESMRLNLKQGMVLYDIGSEQGWCNLIYAEFVGAENMVLIEPTQEFWPNIQQIWDKNYPDVQPMGFYAGLLSDKSTDKETNNFGYWPVAAGGDMIDRNKYQYIHDNEDGIEELKLDDMVKRSGIVPDALTMDVEGAEMLILRGSVDTLKKYMPLVWVSVHPDMSERDYGTTADEVHALMTEIGYDRRLLAIDHEEHWFYFPKGEKINEVE